MSFHNLSLLWATIVSHIYVLRFWYLFVGIQWLNSEILTKQGQIFIYFFFSFCFVRFKIGDLKLINYTVDVSKMLLCWNQAQIGIWCRFYYLPTTYAPLLWIPMKIALRFRSFNRMYFIVHISGLHTIFAWMYSTNNHLRFI